MLLGSGGALLKMLKAERSFSSLSLANRRSHGNHLCPLRSSAVFSSKFSRAFPKKKKGVKEDAAEPIPEGVSPDHRHFFDDLAKDLNISKWEDWYKVDPADIASRSGADFFGENYGGSLMKAVVAFYPNHPWNLFHFQNQQRYWRDPQRQKAFFRHLGKLKNFSKFEDWYSCYPSEVVNHGGAGILDLNQQSLAKSLQISFPEYDFQPWKFVNLPRGYWEETANLKKFMELASHQLGIQKLDQWYEVSVSEFEILGGGPLIASHGTFLAMLSKAFPEHNWKPHKREKVDTKSKEILHTEVMNLLPVEVEVFMDYPHPEILHPETKKPLPLDLFIPSHRIAIIYHGEKSIQPKHAGKLTSAARDIFDGVRATCKKLGITLIEVPYWWDRRRESLIATIHKAAPFLVSERITSPPIPDKEERKYQQQERSKESQMAASTIKQSQQAVVQKAETKTEVQIPAAPSSEVRAISVRRWDRDDDPTGWWISEKLDGVRVLWNGSKLILRQTSAELDVPQFFTADLPNIVLEGDLWCGRWNREKLDEVVSRKSTSSRWESSWREFQFVIFDLPTSELPIEERLEQLRGLKLPHHAKIAEAHQCTGREDFIVHFDKFAEQGGEGLTLRKPFSRYTDKGALCTLSNYHVSEALVVNASSSGILCRRYNGKDFSISFTKNTPQIKAGQVVLVRYNSLSDSGLPYQPSFHDVVEDETWESLAARKTFPYVLTTGKTQGNAVSCVSCRRIIEKPDFRIQKREELCNESGKHQSEVIHNTCLQPDCVEKSVLKRKDGPQIGKILIGASVERAKIPKIEGVEWIEPPSSPKTQVL
eukprot:TRINITY_DN3988_c0_g1_i1.p1 TRINITY_DN3988_c0_g1~~TRINITY_DN3988_c0_g1_i1.p1  ORF type:complete len:821 (-),score=192.21 TRINITY_DN3988_c0_g1_i1:289-2751(-)